MAGPAALDMAFKRSRLAALAGAALCFAVTGCAGTREAASPQDTFFANLQTLCGQTHSGRLETGDPVLDADFAANPLTLGPVACEGARIEIPFAVGEDRSRTWIVTRTQDGLRLKHRHAHGDGEDVLSQYGGDTIAVGSQARQEFPADAFSRDLFLREGRAPSVDNVWAIEITPGEAYVYELARPNRLVRVRFDLQE
jgi:hypothetical protein